MRDKYYHAYTRDNIDYYACNECKMWQEKELDRLNRIVANEKKQREESYQRNNAKIQERILKREIDSKKDLWDEVVRNELAKGIRLTGEKRRQYKESIPKKVLQLTRATMKLQRLIQEFKDGKKSKLQIEQEEKEEEKKRTFTCQVHGERTAKQVVKAGKSKWTGQQSFRCRECLKIRHAKHYQENKEKIRAAHKKYKEANVEKYLQMKRDSRKKMYHLDRNKERLRKKLQNERNEESVRARQKRFKDKATENLTDVYIKQLLVRDTKLKHAQVSQSMVEGKRQIVMTTRNLKKLKTLIKLKGEKVDEQDRHNDKIKK